MNMNMNIRNRLLRNWVFVALAVGVWGTSATIAIASDTREQPQLTIPFQKYSLENGLEIILHQDHRLPLVAVNVWYHVGAVNEKKNKTGFAHLFEHIMFQGSAHIEDDEHFRILEKIGASEINGSTGFDRTNYFQTVPSNHLETALWLESDRMGFLLETLSPEKLENQRDVVRNERRQTTENQPYGLAEEAFWHRIFPPSHPYYGQIIGSMEDLSNASLEDVRSFFSSYYSPQNATLTIAGDFDVDQAKLLVKKYFDTIEGKPPTPLLPLPAVEIKKSFTVRYEEPIAPLAKVEMVWITPKLFAPGDAEADILGNILSSGKSSLLHKKLLRELEMVQSISAYQISLEHLSVFTIEAVVREGVSPEEVVDEIDNVLEEVRQGRIDPAGISRAINQFETKFFLDLERIGHKANLLQSYNHYVGSPDYMMTDLARYTHVTAQGIIDFANTYLSPSNRGVLFAVPPVSKTPVKDDDEKGGEK